MRINNSNINFTLDHFLKNIQLKKQYAKQLKNNILLLNKIKENNYKILDFNLVSKKNLYVEKKLLVAYIVNISFSKVNTIMHIMNCSGKLKLSYSAGSFQYVGKKKIARFIILRKFYRVLISKLKFLKKTPLALHLKNIGPNFFWLFKKLKKKFFIVVVKNFSTYPYNGCRRKKIRRKKFKKLK